MKAKKIAVAGFQHETNTFAPMLAPYEEFVKADAWPGLTLGDELFAVMEGKNLPMAGFMAAANRSHRVLPILWCSAEPSSYVTQDAFERISDMICSGLSKQPQVDAVYLDIHGAMVTEKFEDGEGELLSRIRETIGSDKPLVASLDFHANVTQRMVELADGLTIFRTYPHVDMALAGERAFDLLDLLTRQKRIYKSFKKIPFLIPCPAQCTNFEPCKSIYSHLHNLQHGGVWSVDLAAGFPPADIHECGPALVAYGGTQAHVEHAADELYRLVLNAESDFENPLAAPRTAVREAMASDNEKPVVLADVQDNPGAGGSSDTVGILEALVQNGATGSVMAILNDPGAVNMATNAGEGSVVNINLGGKSGQVNQTPYQGAFKVEKLRMGRFMCASTMYEGMEANIGPMALLRVLDRDCDVRIIVGSERMQCLDLAIFRHMGIQPEKQKILAIKSTVHFRADFDPISSRTLLVEAPGAHPCRLVNLDYKNLRNGVRLEPMGPEHRGQ